MNSDLSARHAHQLARLAPRGQAHVLRFFDRLDPAQQDSLLAQVEAVDLDLLERLVLEMKENRPIAGLPIEGVAPADWIALEGANGAGGSLEARARQVGEELLRRGKVAALVVAGGQGTRLGYDGPKGCFGVGPVSGRSLFAWHAGKVLAARRRYGASIPLLVLTSEANDAATREFFERHEYFGLPKGDVILFRQGMLPAVDFEGRLLLESHDKLALAPDGHGGTLTALSVRGVLSELESRGIEEVFYFQVDNPLIRVLDPVFLGHHRLAGSQMSSKACSKRDAAEKVGVFAANRGQVGVIEYSDLPKDLMESRDDAGRLRFRAGNIAIHVLALPFIKELTRGGLKLPYHRAIKSIPHVDASGHLNKPSDKNGVKFETFIFDALPLAERAIVLETARSEEFSPIKNATGEDSPHTARTDLDALFRRWLHSIGVVPRAKVGSIEIAPTFALDASDLLARVRDKSELEREQLLLE